MLSKKSMDLTLGEQQYSYLYIKDVANVLVSSVESQAESGIYNIASDKQYSLKYILSLIRDNLNPTFNLNFGALPYRKGQSMINASSTEKANNAFGKINASDFNDKLTQTIEYYKEIYK
jgi:nucleoside-diphosphate-sugar epimerase